jgi:hypothetical protein
MPKLKCTGPISEVVVRARKRRVNIKHEPGTIIEVEQWLVDPLVESGNFALVSSTKPKEKKPEPKEKIEKGKE